MEISKELLFFFSALGAFNGIVLSLYFLFFVKSKHISNKFLGAFLLMMSIRTGKSVFFYFNPDLSFHYLQFGLTACLFIGPFLYFYVMSVKGFHNLIKKEWKYHFGFLLITALIVGFLYPFEANIHLWRPYFINAIYYIWLAYTLFAAYKLVPTLRSILFNRSKVASLDIWVLSIFFGNFAVWASYKFSYFTSYITGALTFSFLFYIMILFLVYNKKKNKVIFSPTEKYADKRFDSSEAMILIETLKKVMNEESLYKNPNLKSSDVALKIQLTTHQFSQLLNDNLGKNFASFINEYRIEEAKKRLLSNSNFTLEAIAYDCGFNSKSTFYTAFKKIEGVTPTQFKSSNL
ncbi:helix-turn-helix domain-containing protein [Pseudotenacibaculum sp. MALMAid0570]|uniref:helix-turn-helix domain-containing protein n=1 Tax=Pseudotenacibaculum sp. MALMAid0570 TaxID=3143938 RepID=UPI0032DF14CA